MIMIEWLTLSTQPSDHGGDDDDDDDSGFRIQVHRQSPAIDAQTTSVMDNSYLQKMSVSYLLWVESNESVSLNDTFLESAFGRNLWRTDERR
jgi:hypothetical protein